MIGMLLQYKWQFLAIGIVSATFFQVTNWKDLERISAEAKRRALQENRSYFEIRDNLWRAYKKQLPLPYAIIYWVSACSLALFALGLMEDLFDPLLKHF